jgi:hypothetical protein
MLLKIWPHHYLATNAIEKHSKNHSFFSAKILAVCERILPPKFLNQGFLSSLLYLLTLTRIIQTLTILFDIVYCKVEIGVIPMVDKND